MILKQNQIRHSIELISAGQLCRIKISRVEAKARILFMMGMVCEFPSALNIRLCGEAEMRQTNLTFRGKDTSTDVLSFSGVPGSRAEPWSVESSKNQSVYALGDLLICVPVCRVQAKKHKVSLSQEIDRMVVHGLVHLRGFDHERSDSAWRVMAALEKSIVQELRREFEEPHWAQDLLQSNP